MNTDRVINILTKEEDKLMGKLLAKNLQQKLLNGQFKDSGNEFYELMHDINQQNLSLQKKAATYKYYLVTVNTPLQELPTDDSVEFKQLMTKVERYVRRKGMIMASIYCYEFYGKKSNHLHSHILVYTGGKVSNSDFDRNTRNTFKDVCDSTNRKILNIEPISEAKVQEKYKYICGLKQKGKMAQVEKDVAWLQMLGYRKFYDSEQPFPFQSATQAETEGGELLLSPPKEIVNSDCTP